MRAFIQILFFLIISAAALTAQQTYKVSAGGKLNISVLYGDIIIRPWDKNELQIKYEDTEVRAGIRQDGNTISIDMADAGDEDVVIDLPASFNVSFNSRAGDFKIEKNITGSVEGSTGGGDIKLKDVYGSVNMRTAGGDFAAGKVTGNLEFYSAGGNIKIDDIGGRAMVNTGGGNITLGSIGADASVSTAGGNIKAGDIRGNAQLQTSGGNVTVGKVAGKVHVTSSGGNIQVKSGSGSVSANTASGNIVLHNISGGVNVNTASGRVEVHLNPLSGTKSSISTTIGDILLYIPASAKTRVNALVNYKDWKSGVDKSDKPIQSDFPESSYIISKENRQVIAEYTINSADSHIDIRANMGKVKIIKE